MNKNKLLIWILAVIVFAFLIFYYTALQNLLSNFLQKEISLWGYTGFFVIVFLLEILPQPFISGLVPFTIALLFGLHFWYLFIIMVVSALSANYIAYAIGRKYGDAIIGKYIHKNNYGKSILWFEKYGKMGITFVALSPLPYFPIIGGIFKMSVKEFTYYAIIPRFIHFAIFCSVIAFFL